MKGTVKYQKVELRPEFSTNHTFENPLKNPTPYLVKAGFLRKPTSQKPT